MKENRMKPSVNTGEVSLPSAQSAGWGRKIGGQEANVTENSQFGTAKWLATPSDGRIIATMTEKIQFEAMNERSNGKSRSKTNRHGKNKIRN